MELECSGVIEFIEFCYKYLDIPVDILSIEFEDLSDMNILGYTIISDYEIGDTIILVVDENNISLETISHEFVHIKQIYTSKLSCDSDFITWNSKHYISIAQFDIIFDNMSNDDVHLERYNNFPWEVEANKESQIIIKEYERLVKNF